MGIAIFFLVIGGLLGLWVLISPKAAWRVTTAWRYKDPEAHEPSEAGYAAQRVGGGIALVLSVLAIIVIAGSMDDIQRDRQEDAYQECLDEHRNDDEGLLEPEDWCENLSPSPVSP